MFGVMNDSIITRFIHVLKHHAISHECMIMRQLNENFFKDFLFANNENPIIN